MWFPNVKLRRTTSEFSHGKQIRTKNKESFGSKVLKQKQLCVKVAVSVLVS